MLRWPSIAAIASRLMPRLMAWVARVWRSWWGWMCGSPAAAPALLRIRVTVCRSSGSAVLPGQQQRVLGRDVRGAVVVDQRRPGGGAAAGSGRRGACRPGRAARARRRCARRRRREGGELADAQPGASSTSTVTRTSSRGSAWAARSSLRGGGVVEGLGQRVVLAGQVAGEDRHPGRRVVPAPLDDPDEEHPQRAEPVRQGGGGEPGLVLPGPVGEPGLVVLDVAAGDLRDAGDLGCGLDQERGERAQREVGAARRCPGAARRRAGPGSGASWPRSAGRAARAASQVGSSSGPLTGHARTPARCWSRLAGVAAGRRSTSAALRYWAASQSSARCR